jgi:DNA-binding transcriptional regulator PaaX
MDKYRAPSLTDLLIATLASSRSTYRFKAILKERQFKKYRKESMRNTFTRLRKKGYVDNSVSGWALTVKGKKFSQKRTLLGYIPSPFPKHCAAGMIISFDIPESERKLRNWLRNQIKIFGYTMLHQSLWIGPGPLPPVFLKRLDNLGIRKKIKTFKIKQANTV